MYLLRHQMYPLFKAALTSFSCFLDFLFFVLRLALISGVFLASVPEILRVRRGHAWKKHLHWAKSGRCKIYGEVPVKY